MNLFKPERDILKHYNSPEQFLSAAKALPPSFFSDIDPEWSNGTSAQAKTYLEYGSDKYLDQAKALIDKMQLNGLFAHGQKLWMPSVVGAFPNVPNAIMNLPETMYQLEETDIQSETTPLKVYVELGADWRVAAEDLIKRGVAIMAFALAMKQVRGIELYCVSSVCPNYDLRQSSAATIIQTIRLETNPLDLERATYMLCDPSMYRQLVYANSFKLDNDTRWHGRLPFAWNKIYGDKDRTQTMREILNLNPDDCYFNGVAKGMEQEYKTPLAWVEKTLSQYGLNHENEH